MRKLSDTIARLSALRSVAPAASTRGGSRLTALDGFAPNPGGLDAHIHVPADLAEGAALVVVLHGCTQDAAGYDSGSGWSTMADRHGFALLFPEQRRQNNPNLCFNWFNPEDSRRGSGEARSIREMIATVVAAHAIDPRRIFVTGLSAGGAMASVMLATYPDVFAGGAIIAGLPYGCASTVPQAFDRMRGHAMPGEAELGALVRDASVHAGPWPTVSIWHGSGDATVSPANADAIVRQWRSLHGAGAAPDRVEAVDRHPRRVWRDAEGRDVIEAYSIAGMGHGTPLDTAGADGCGVAGAFMLEAGISSTRHICRFWGLTPQDDAAARARDGQSRVVGVASRVMETEKAGVSAQAADRGSPGAKGATKVIEDALRAAGLMR